MSITPNLDVVFLDLSEEIQAEVRQEMAAVNPTKLHNELVGALGNEVVSGVSVIDGEVTVHLMQTPTDSQLAQIDEVLTAHDGSPLYSELRLAAYAQQIPLEDFIEALFEALEENRPEKLNALQASRLAIKAQYPKPS